MQWYRMKKYRSSPSKETFLFSADLYGVEDKTSTMPAYVKLRNGNNCSFDNAESESYWDGTSNDDITDEYDMIWYDMIWYHWLSILRISVLTILLMNSRSISMWGNRPGSSSATGRRECECFSRMEDQNEVDNISDTVATNIGYLFIRNKETKDVRNRAFFSIDSVIPWIASWKLKVKLTVSFSQTCLDRNMLIPRKSRRLVFELLVRRDLLYWSRLKRKEIIQQLHIYDTKGT